MTGVGYDVDMRIFALETDREKVVQSLVSSDEKLIMAIGFHWLRFFVHFLLAVLFTGLLIAFGWLLLGLGAPQEFLLIAGGIAWLVTIAWPLFKKFIDWRYDLIVITNGKIVIVDQSTIVRQYIRQMNIENIASVESLTQFWNIFPFGKVRFNLKEGVGEVIQLAYIPQAARVASIVSQVIINFEREHGLNRTWHRAP